MFCGKYFRNTLGKVSRSFSGTESEAPPIKPFLSRVSERCLLKLTGKDHSSVLQGLATHDHEAFLANKDQGISHTAFLNNKGRIITDAMLIKPLSFQQNAFLPKNDELWLETYSESEEEIISHLKKYSFRKEMKVESISDKIDTLCLYVGSFDSSIQK